MSKVNIKRTVENIRANTTVYSPIVEVVVNALQSIESAGRQDGHIAIRIQRDGQNEMDGGLPEIRSFEVEDNGLGFTEANRESFDTLYSDLKISEGGKGFGRFICLKYFANVSIDSVFAEGIARVEATDGLGSGFANTLITSANVCDADANGTVNEIDIALIEAAIGQTVLPGDPRDFLHTGVITAGDVTGCRNLIAAPSPAMPPSITESFGAASIAAEGSTSLSFTITNPNPATILTGIAFTDSLPSGLIVASPNGLADSCGGGTITAVPRSATVSLSGAALAPAASCTFSVSVTGTATGPQNNSVTVTSVNGGIGNTSLASVAVVASAPPPSSVTCPAISSGEVGVAFSSPVITVTAGTPPYTFSVVGTLTTGLTLNPSTGSITGTAAAAGTFSIEVTDSTGVVLAGTCPFTFSLTITSNASFQVRYAANLNIGESYIDITNTGANGAALLGPGYGTAAGNICVNVYAFDPAEELIACCSCLVTPDQTVNLGVNRDLTVKTLTGAIPTSVTVKLLTSLAGGDGTGTSCTNSAATVTTATLAGGTAAWGTTLHADPTAGVYDTVETPFIASTLSQSEMASIGGRCAGILGNGSGFGICNSCRGGALGARPIAQ